jgi:hypothetical protein
MSEQEPSAKALKIANGIAQMRHPPLSDELREAIARDIDAYAAARVAEAVAAERARIVAALRKHIARHKEAFDLHREVEPLIANEHNAARWGMKKAIAIALDEDAP